jgi:hypothetical protein
VTVGGWERDGEGTGAGTEEDGKRTESEFSLELKKVVKFFNFSKEIFF